MIEEKFRVIARFSDATNFGARNLKMFADFENRPHRPRFQVELKSKIANKFLVNNVFIRVDVYEPEIYLNPKEVLKDLAKTYPEESGNNWEINSPTDLEAFLRKYAWLSKLNGKLPLFEKLLEYR